MNRIVLFVAVVVMNDFASTQWSADRGLHNNDVLANVSVSISPGVAGHQEQPVSILHNEWLSFRGGVTSQRAKPRAIVSSGTDSDWLLAKAARRADLQPPAFQATEVPDSVEFATGAMKLFSAPSARHVHRQLSPPFSRGTSQLNSCRRFHLTVPNRSRIAPLVAVDSSRSKSAWREIHSLAARSAHTFHWRRVPRWKKKDLGHFEYVPPEVSHA